MTCTLCSHAKTLHNPDDGKCWRCDTCPGFADRIDPTPPMPLDPDGGDDSGNPGAF